MKKILLIDDEASIRNFLRVTLLANDYKFQEAKNAKDAVSLLAEFQPDLIILDYGLPDMSGLELLKIIRRTSTTPVIFLTVRDSEQDKVDVLDSGADDYLVKPFNIGELLARIRVALRHSVKVDGEEHQLNFGKLRVDIQDHKIYYDNNDLKLTATEFSLLKLLVTNGERLVSHQTILKEIWGPNSLEHLHYLRVYFGHIRKKLDKAYTGSGAMIENESGVGYRLKQF
jgi:two-component system KDP operon response regulator KdpE